MMMESGNRTRRLAFVVGVLLILGSAVWAVSKATTDAIGGAVAIGTAISTGEITADAATQIVKLFRDERLDNAEIRRIFEALMDTSLPLASGNVQDTGPATRNGNRGMGAFVLDAHARGLRGRALADAIHVEQARRGTPGQARGHDTRVREGRRDSDSKTVENRGNGPGNGRVDGHRGNGPGGPGRTDNENRGNR